MRTASGRSRPAPRCCLSSVRSPRRHVVVEHRARRDQRLVAVAEALACRTPRFVRRARPSTPARGTRCGAPRRSRSRCTRIAAAPSSRSHGHAKCLANTSTSSSITSARCGTSSFQCRGPGSADGRRDQPEVAALVVGADVEARRRGGRRSTRGPARRGSDQPATPPSGWSAGRKRTSDVVWLRDRQQHVRAARACAPRRRRSARPSPRRPASSSRLPEHVAVQPVRRLASSSTV